MVYRKCSIWSCAIAIAVSVTNDVSCMLSVPSVYYTHSCLLTLFDTTTDTILYPCTPYNTPLYHHQPYTSPSRGTIKSKTTLSTRSNLPNNQDDGSSTRSDILRILQRINVSPPFLHLNFDTFSEGSSSQLSSFRSLPS